MRRFGRRREVIGARILFKDHDIYQFVEYQKARLGQEYNSVPDDKALDESFIQELKHRYMLDIPTLKPDQWSKDERENETIIYVAFEGDPAAFRLKPSAFNGTIAVGDVLGKDLFITVSNASAGYDVLGHIKRESAKVE
jgi:hypothetical protein